MLTKLTQKQREEVIEKIQLETIADMSCYEDFILECVGDVIKQWDDEELLQFYYGDDQNPDCILCEGKENCPLEEYQDCYHNPINQ